MSGLRTLTRKGTTHVALESRFGYVLLCQPDGVPGEIGLFARSTERSFLHEPRHCRLCAHLLASAALLGLQIGTKAEDDGSLHLPGYEPIAEG